ncbi:MAG: PTS system mannose/fructose/sorbose family transporter subunit IID [Lactobacillus sp.]|uniref:PTS system mannose/fructose/sorbose family transporter subunit IID n=1 Tax=Lacticaseibacillus suilingensis TaxID=2799577 RepID=A0ABW4BHA4_9LACO|nr:PTS system mannose/fructose/sorbose family transporter subunit IID [Lacticaseibacillus suilingensis]MCI1894359.1 PTS system mannose/fructose/sorbose family transporter subunit IID [Lactobacillus sp.]MCI1917296.1 PTS system mannose/fructose/sorbose family transporter subunit IID [Lactobacillus sp.]MCI1941079.1 PTS system mannose/fructose/sorbose family transporter subunit IID [Lactobacillus sp.]MCI1971622.1 PTS system mannose/fructose/sorbose family transporter subunit IID [Lactobacillus sp.]
MSNQTKNLTAEDKKNIHSIFWRGFTVMGEMTYVRMQGPGFGWTMMPLMRKLYKDDDQYYAAVKRHMQYFNTNPVFLPFLQGIVYQMEKENAEKPVENIEESVQGLKVGLMGPLAGLGDSFFTGTWRVITTGVALGLAAKGNILGPILFLLLFHIPYYLVRYYGGVLGYKVGANYIAEAQSSGLLKSITKGCSMLGLIMIGAMSFLNVPLKFTVNTKFGGVPFKLQDTLDGILKGIVPLAVIWFLIWLLRKKKVSTTAVLISVIVVSAVLGGLGIII